MTLIPPLYRYMKLEHLHEMINSKIFMLRRFDVWPDKYESYTDTVVLADCNEGEILGPQFKGCMYGSCFTYGEESAAMWKIYSEEGKFVRIEINVDELERLRMELNRAAYPGIRNFPAKREEVNPSEHIAIRSAKVYFSDKVRQYDEAMSRCNLEGNHPFAVIRKVEYVTLDKMRERIRSYGIKVAQQIDSGSAILPDTFMEEMYTKRNCYRHEEEVRLCVYWEKSEHLTPDRLGLQWAIDPKKFIKSIVFDPKMSDDEVEKEKKNLLECLGKDILMRKSDIYDKPNMEITDLHLLLQIRAIVDAYIADPLLGTQTKNDSEAKDLFFSYAQLFVLLARESGQGEYDLSKERLDGYPYFDVNFFAVTRDRMRKSNGIICYSVWKYNLEERSKVWLKITLDGTQERMIVNDKEN